MCRSSESIDGSERTTSSIPSACSFYGSLHIVPPLYGSLYTDPPLRREEPSYVSGNGELAFQTYINTEHTDQRHTDCWELEKVRFLGLTKVRPRAGGGCFQLQILVSVTHDSCVPGQSRANEGRPGFGGKA